MIKSPESSLWLPQRGCSPYTKSWADARAACIFEGVKLSPIFGSMEMELGLSQHWGYPVSMSNPEIHHIKNIACAGPNFRNTQFFVFELPQRNLPSFRRPWELLGTAVASGLCWLSQNCDFGRSQFAALPPSALLRVTRIVVKWPHPQTLVL